MALRQPIKPPVSNRPECGRSLSRMRERENKVHFPPAIAVQLSGFTR